MKNVTVEPMRGMLKYIKKSGASDLVGCEVGVMKGTHAMELIEILPMKKLYLVDPYLPYIDFDGYIKKKVLLDKKIAYNKLKDYNVEFIYKNSKKSSKMFMGDTLDFVYIDANHSYKHVLEDINFWYPKVKDGGVIGGHDFDSQHQDVILAVLEFMDKNNLKLDGTDNVDWWIVKEG